MEAGIDYRKLLSEKLEIEYSLLGEIYSEKIRWQYRMQNQVDRIGFAQWIINTIANIILTEPIRITTNNETINQLIDNIFLGNQRFNSSFSKFLPYLFGIGDGVLTVHRGIDGLPSINYIPIYNVIPIRFNGDYVSELAWFNFQHVDEKDYIILVIERQNQRETRLYECAKTTLNLIEYGNPLWVKILGADVQPIINFNENLVAPKFAWVSTGLMNARWINTPFHNSFLWPWWLINDIEKAWKLLQDELIASKKIMFVDKSLVQVGNPQLVDPATGMQTMTKGFDLQGNIYQMLEGLPPTQQIYEHNPQVRLDQFIEFFRFQVQEYCQIVGLGADFYSLFKSGNPATATQVLFQHKDAYNTINQVKYNLTTAIQTLVYGFIDYWIEDGLLTEDDRPMSIYEIGIEFSDGVFTDLTQKLQLGSQLYHDGVLTPFTYLTKYCNFSKADALNEIRMRMEMENQVKQNQNNNEEENENNKKDDEDNKEGEKDNAKEKVMKQKKDNKTTKNVSNKKEK